MICELYPVALDCGMSINQFWQLSILEIQDFIQSKRRSDTQRVKEDISLQFLLAKLVGEQIAAMYQKDFKLSKPWDLYPELFDQESEEVKRLQEENALADYKERRLAFALRHNEKMKKISLN